MILLIIYVTQTYIYIYIFLSPPLSKVIWALLAFANLVESQQTPHDWKSPPTQMVGTGGKKTRNPSVPQKEGTFYKRNHKCFPTKAFMYN